MTSCDELRAAVVSAKARRNDAMRANAQAEDASQPAPYTTADMDALRLAVDVAALEATQRRVRRQRPRRPARRSALMAALIIVGASLQLVGVVCGYTFSDPALGHGLMMESFDSRRQMWGARIGLVCTVVGFCVSVGAAVAAI